MDDRVYWIWAQQTFGVGSPMPFLISKRFNGGIEEFHQGGPRLWNTCGFVAEREAQAMFSFSLEEAQARLEYAEKVGWQVITPQCANYPGPLRNIYDPPAVLYVKGTLPDMEHVPAIGVAGARKATEDSLRAASRFGFQLAAGGAVVISGGAVGVDGSVLSGALSASGKVVSILPVDLGSPYLNQNAALRRLIPQRGGALVSEYFSQRSPERGGFQIRNRLISGCACGVLLIQAAMKSGTMIYAKHAGDQSRDVFVYPGQDGDMETEAFAGSKSLAEDGAKPVTCGEEILEEYMLRFSRKENPFAGIFPGPVPPRERLEPILADSGKAPQCQVPKEFQSLWEALGEGPMSISQLEASTGENTASILGKLTQMELLGLAQALPGKRYRRG